MIDWEKQVNNAWKVYKDLNSLGRLPLAETPTCQILLWGMENTVIDRGYAVRALLSWSVRELESKSVKRYHNYASTLTQHCIKQKPIKNIATSEGITIRGVHGRLESARKASAAQLAQAQFDNTSIATTKDFAVIVRYEDVGEQAQQVAQYLSLFQRPENRLFLASITKLPVERNLTPLVTSGLLQEMNDHYIVHPKAINWLRSQCVHDEARRWHRMIGRHYQKRDFLSTVYHWQAAAMWSAALDLLFEHVESFTDDTPLDRWQQRLEKFEISLLSAEQKAKLYLLQGRIFQLRDNATKAKAAFEKAQQQPDLSKELRLQLLYHATHAQQETDVGQFNVEHMLKLDPEELSDWTIKAKLLLAWMLIERQSKREKGRMYLEQVEPRFEAGEFSAELQAKYHNTWGELFRRMSTPDDYDEYIRHCRAAHQFALQSGDTIYVLKMQYNLGLALLQCERYEEGAAILKRNYEACMSNNAEWVAAHNRSAMGRYWIYGQHENFDRAVNCYLEAYAYFSRTKNKRSIASVCLGLVWSYLELCQGREAKKYYEEGVRIVKELDHAGMGQQFEWYPANYVELRHDLTDRQYKAICCVRKEKLISNQRFQELTGISNKTAATELKKLVRLGIFKKVGGGRSTRYVLADSAD